MVSNLPRCALTSSVPVSAIRRRQLSPDSPWRIIGSERSWTANLPSGRTEFERLFRWRPKRIAPLRGGEVGREEWGIVTTARAHSRQRLSIERRVSPANRRSLVRRKLGRNVDGPTCLGVKVALDIKTLRAITADESGHDDGLH